MHVSERKKLWLITNCHSVAVLAFMFAQMPNLKYSIVGPTFSSEFSQTPMIPIRIAMRNIVWPEQTSTGQNYIL